MIQSDAALVFSDKTPEPERATWIAAELAKRGRSVFNRQYSSEDHLPGVLRQAQGQARAVVVLFSAATVEKAGLAFVEFKLSGHKSLPVRCESHPKYPLMADLVHADIFGLDQARDVAQVTRLIQAIG